MPRGRGSTSYYENTQTRCRASSPSSRRVTGSDATLTWQELLDRVERTATLLLALGVRPGECVAYQLPNCLEFVIVSLATLRVGAICCPLMPIFREREVAFCLRRSGARILFVPDEARGRHHAGEILSLLREASIFGRDLPLRLEHVIVSARGRKVHPLPAPDNENSVQWLRFQESLDAIEVDSAALDLRRADAKSVVQLLFTSGTSGEPKGVLHRNDVLMRAAAMEVEHLGLGRRRTEYSFRHRSPIRPASCTACGLRS